MVAHVGIWAVFAAGCVGLGADEASKAGPEATVAERVAAFRGEIQARERAVSRELAAARKAGAVGGSKEIKAILGRFKDDHEAIANKILSLVRARPDDPAALDGILLLGAAFDDDVVTILRARFMDDPRMGQLCTWLPQRTTDSTKALLKDLAAGSPDRNVRAQATYALGAYASGLQKELTSVHRLSEADQTLMMAAIQRKFYQQAVAGRRLTGPEEEALLGEARGYFERVVKDYPGVNSADGSFRLADRARTELVRIANAPGLKVGKVAPGFAGEDLDGRPLNLDDYRGKVVVVCFWATWCGPCMAMVPRERALVERTRGKPFALVGVNADLEDDREKAKTAARDKKMTWPSLWDGGFNGPTQVRYNVDHYPTVYVLDRRGVIRHIDPEGDDLDRAVDALLAEPGAPAGR